MSVHASDVALVVKAALDASDCVGEAEFVTNTPNPDAGFPNRDGSYEYVCVGRDCFRGFRITVEAIPFEDVDRLAHPEQYDWEPLTEGGSVSERPTKKELNDAYAVMRMIQVQIRDELAKQQEEA